MNRKVRQKSTEKKIDRIRREIEYNSIYLTINK